jgi:hypothetical protein
MTAAELRAKIRALMASGDLPKEPPSIERRGSREARVLYAIPSSEPCTVCGELGSPVVLFYIDGLVVRLHTACEALWQQERPGAPDSHDKATGAS